MARPALFYLESQLYAGTPEARLRQRMLPPEITSPIFIPFAGDELLLIMQRTRLCIE